MPGDNIPTAFTVPLVEYTRLAMERDELRSRLAETEAKIAELRDALGCEMDDTRNACGVLNDELDRVNKRLAEEARRHMEQTVELVNLAEGRRVRLAEATELLREARDDVVEASNHTHKPHAVAYYKEQIARIDAYLSREQSKE